jgi:AAA domain
VDDPRPDALLEEAARLLWRVGGAVAWTDGLTPDEKAKKCSRVGSGAWKRARPLRERHPDESEAAGYFVTRCRKANPVVTASGSGWDLVEYDGGRDELDRLHGIPRLPDSLGWHSKRGPHLVFLAPPGEAPRKFQVDETGVVKADDGYLVCAPAWRPEHGVVYALNGAREPVAMPARLRELLLVLGDQADAVVRERLDTDEPIYEGQRTESIKLLVLRRLREGVAYEQALEAAFAFNASRCRPPLARELVERTVKGLARWAAKHPTEQELLRGKAREALEGKRAPVAPRAKRDKRALLRRPLQVIGARPLEFLIDRVVPKGTLTMIAGVGGLGKSALALAYAKRVTDRGGNVLIVSYEDAAEQVLRPRFEALGGNLELVHELYVDLLDGSISFPADLGELDRHVLETEAVLVLIDPVSASIDLKLDAHKDQDVRVVLGQLAQLAERERLAILQNAHLNKAPSADPYLRINGSTAFYNASRSVLTVTRDPEEPDLHRLVAHHKSNYGPLADVERWKVEPVMVATGYGPMEVMTMQFVEIAEGVSRDDVLATRSAGAEKLDKAVAYLQGMLADGEWHDSDGLITLAGAAHLSERTLRRAAFAELKVEHERRGFPSSTWWRLASHAKPSPQELA